MKTQENDEDEMDKKEKRRMTIEKNAKEDLSDVYSLEPKFIFGLIPGLSNNCFFLNDDNIIYHAAGVLVIHNILSNTQKFVYLREPQKIITTMELNNAKNLVAIAEKGKKPSISIYDVLKNSCIRQLSILVELKSNSIVKMKFTHDDSYLIALTGDPDHVMYYFDWKMSKLDSHVQIINPPKIVGPVNDMAVNPSNKYVCCFVGNDLFRSMAKSDLVWREYGFHKANKREFTTVCWLNADNVLAGTADGRLFLVEKGEMKAAYNLQTLIEFNPTLSTIHPLALQPLPDGQPLKITLCTHVSSKLMFVVNGHWVYYYKLKQDDKYKKNTQFLITRDIHLETIENDEDLHLINTLSVSPNTNLLVCVTKRSQLFLTSTNEKSGIANARIDTLGVALHHGGVRAMSVATWKPVFATCGKMDRTVKFWNYAHRSLLLTHVYEENILNVVLNPSGLHVIVALSSTVEICKVLYSDEKLEPRIRFDVANSTLAQFSGAGHMFAIVDGFDVNVYSSVTFDLYYKFEGHGVRITDIVWAANDWKLILCNESGRLFQFNVHTCGPAIDIVKYDEEEDNMPVLTGVAVSNDKKQIFTISQDGRIREIYITTVIRDKDLEHGPLNDIVLSKASSMLLVASHNGVILSLELPLKSQIAHKAFYIHCKTVSQMMLTMDDRMLITCSMDNSICLWLVKPPKGIMLQHKTLRLPDDILISTKTLKQKIDRNTKLHLRLKELTKTTAQDTVKLIKAYDAKIKKITDDHKMITMRRIEKEEKEITLLFNNDKTRLENEISRIMEQQKDELIKLKKVYGAKLEAEDVKYGVLEKKMFEIDLKLKKRSETNINMHTKKMLELEHTFNEELNNLERIFRTFEEQIMEERRKINVDINEYDDQCDREFLELKMNFIEKFRKWSKRNKKVQMQIAVLKPKVRSAVREEEDLRYLDEKYREDIVKKKEQLNVLNGLIMESDRKVQDCNIVVIEKDRWIEVESLALANMQKQLIVLNCYKEEQKKVIGPHSIKLYSLRETVDEMKELAREHEKIMGTFTATYDRDKIVIKSTLKTLKRKRKIIRENETKFKELFYTFDAEEAFVKTKAYLTRQMDLLERCYEHLKIRKLNRVQKTPSHLRMITENKYLIETYNKLRKQSQVNQNNYNDLLCKKRLLKLQKNMVTVETEAKDDQLLKSKTEEDDDEDDRGSGSGTPI